MNCPKCGSNVEMGELFCKTCGSSLQVANNQVQNNVVPNNSNIPGQYPQPNYSNNMQPQQVMQQPQIYNNQPNPQVPPVVLPPIYSQQPPINAYNQPPYAHNNVQAYNPYQQYGSFEDVLIDTYIGKNSADFKRDGFSVAAFFLGVFYLLYRKMWTLAISIILISIITSVFLQELAGLISIGIPIYLGISARSLYMKHVKTKVNKIMQSNNGMANEQLLLICSQKGGTSVLAAFAPIIVVFALSFILAMLSY
jgi:Protein of unknown function (DUF2628).